MDFGSFVETLSNGPFNWATGPITSACAHNCFDKNHYHRYCGCALHAIDSGFRSPACSPSPTVKVSGAGSRGGRMYRSISVQNLGEKKFQNVSCNHDELASPAAFSPTSFSSSFSSFGVRTDDMPSFETLELVEQIASFINLMKTEDTVSSTQHDDDEIYSGASGRAADEDEGSQALPTISYSSQPIGVPSRSASQKTLHDLVTVARFAPDHVLPLRLSLLEKLSIRPPSPRLDAAANPNFLPSHRKIESCGR